MTITRSRTLRTIGWAAAYVLALHAILLSFAPLNVNAAPGSPLQILCLTSTDDGGAAPHAGDVHCPDCTAAHAAAPPPSPLVIGVTRIAHVHTIRAIVAERQHTEASYRPGQPRAPPILA